jgi:hypothetical protein
MVPVPGTRCARATAHNSSPISSSLLALLPPTASLEDDVEELPFSPDEDDEDTDELAVDIR